MGEKSCRHEGVWRHEFRSWTAPTYTPNEGLEEAYEQEDSIYCEDCGHFIGFEYDFAITFRPEVEKP